MDLSETWGERKWKKEETENWSDCLWSHPEESQVVNLRIILKKSEAFQMTWYVSGTIINSHNIFEFISENFRAVPGSENYYSLVLYTS